MQPTLAPAPHPGLQQHDAKGHSQVQGPQGVQVRVCSAASLLYLS